MRVLSIEISEDGSVLIEGTEQDLQQFTAMIAFAALTGVAESAFATGNGRASIRVVREP